jgi:nitrobindin-like protein
MKTGKIESKVNTQNKSLLRRMAVGAYLLFLLSLAPTILAQTAQQPDVWEPLKYFVGSWEGTGKGQPGEAKVEREYQFVLKGKYLEAKNKSTYAPQEKNPKGEVHEDWGLFSYDRGRKQFVLRQFHVEGFVNQYKLDLSASDDKTLVFVTESIENIPAGWRAKESYRILNNDEFVEVFELAAPGKEFEVYSENRFKRKK